MYQVIKRDGKISEFDIAKISNAIQKAFDAVERQYHPSIIDMLALRVTSDFEPKIRHDRIQVEDIQDSVESILIQSGYGDSKMLYPLSEAAGKNPEYEIHNSGLQGACRQLCESHRLARKRKFNGHLFRRRTDFE